MVKPGIYLAVVQLGDCEWWIWRRCQTTGGRMAWVGSHSYRKDKRGWTPSESYDRSASDYRWWIWLTPDRRGQFTGAHIARSSWTITWCSVKKRGISVTLLFSHNVTIYLCVYSIAPLCPRKDTEAPICLVCVLINFIHRAVDIQQNELQENKQ